MSSTDYKFDASPVTIGGLLKKGFFKIPRYQRSYSWEDKHYGDLWEDLSSTIEHDQPHYIGTIVLQKNNLEIEDKGGRPYNSFLIVDGQQRLITISIYAMALYRHLKKINKYRADALWKDFVKHENLETRKGNQLRILPGSSNQSHFSKLVKSIRNEERKKLTPKSSSDKLLQSAFEFYDRKLNAARENRGDEWIIEMSRALRSKVQILPFVTEERAFAIKMFQTVNDRGKPISLLDKIKGFLMFYTVKYVSEDEDIIETTDRIFETIFKQFDKSKEISREYSIKYISNPRYQFSESEISKFAYHYVFRGVKSEFNLEASYKYDIRAEDVLSFIKTACHELQDDPQKLRQLINTIVMAFEKVSNGLVDLLESVAEEPEASPISNLIRWQSASAAVYPLLINAYVEEKLTDEMIDLARVLDMRVYKIRGTEPKAGLYRNSVSHFSSNKNTQKIKYEIRNFIKKWGSNKEIRKYVEGDMYDNNYSKFLLWEWSRHEYSVSESWGYSFFDQLEREHIFPKENNKIEILDYGFEDDEDYVSHRDTLGNLCLIEQHLNPKAGNSQPSRKASSYQESNLGKTASLGAKIEESGFNKENIEKRNEDIADFVLSHWAIPECPSN